MWSGLIIHALRYSTAKDDRAVFFLEDSAPWPRPRLDDDSPLEWFLTCCLEEEVEGAAEEAEEDWVDDDREYDRLGERGEGGLDIVDGWSMYISSLTAAATKAAAALADLRTDRPLSVDTSGAILCFI